MSKSAIVVTLSTLLLSAGQLVESPISSTTPEAGESSESAAPDMPDPESVRHIPELAWHAWQAGTHDRGSCALECWDQLVLNVHVAYDLGPVFAVNEWGDGPHSAPYSGSCQDNHPECGWSNSGPGQGAMAAIDDAIRTGDAAWLRSILDEDGGGSAYITWERSAIQVFDCSESGELVAHIPVPGHLLAAVED